MELNTQEIIKQSYKNTNSIAKSNQCGCYNCTKIFTPDMIVEYIDNGQTVVCPFCGIDSVLGSNMGYDFNLKFLTKLKKEIFEDDNTIYINKN
ncbi:hypothetical protein [Carnobacterium inhibens]|uniref:hypothetical protein n=1 Tax=Carnobacterium inhibens TaxID=147709 RepID=UPI000557C43B|nr:hypothetical protein [Carnobacterium inhibens]